MPSQLHRNIRKLLGQYPTKQLEEAHRWGVRYAVLVLLLAITALILLAPLVSAAPDKNTYCSAWTNITPSECDEFYEALTNTSTIVLNQTELRYINTTVVQQVENEANLTPYALKTQIQTLQELITKLNESLDEQNKLSAFDLLQAEREHNLTVRELEKKYELLAEEARINQTKQAPTPIDTSEFLTRSEAADIIEDRVEDEVRMMTPTQTNTTPRAPITGDWFSFILLLGGAGYAAYYVLDQRKKDALNVVKSQPNRDHEELQAKVSRGETLETNKYTPPPKRSQ